MEHVIQDETTLTQPYEQGRCWYGKRRNKKDANRTRTCGEQAQLCEMRHADAARTGTIKAYCWLCPKHQVSMRDKGYVITVLTAEQVQLHNEGKL